MTFTARQTIFDPVPLVISQGIASRWSAAKSADLPVNHATCRLGIASSEVTVTLNWHARRKQGISVGLKNSENLDLCVYAAHLTRDRMNGLNSHDFLLDAVPNARSKSGSKK